MRKAFDVPGTGGWIALPLVCWLGIGVLARGYVCPGGCLPVSPFVRFNGELNGRCRPGMRCRVLVLLSNGTLSLRTGLALAPSSGLRFEHRRLDCPAPRLLAWHGVLVRGYVCPGGCPPVSPFREVQRGVKWWVPTRHAALRAGALVEWDAELAVGAGLGTII